MSPIDSGVPDSFQDQIEEYNSNFERLNTVLGDNTQLVDGGAIKAVRVEETKELLARALPIAVTTIIGLAANADSESVRYNASKLLIDISLGKDPGLQADDPVANLVARLQGHVDD